ncbi:semaphorin-4A-like [Brienomyrus brachyistius]|uniref:semaphorin-4A-like n=1 Tax=Brienomyrus brachyistius TaxID=42636 RepID=UPI0020B40E3E|nr:semaphorin-4A-like [Brienomyrus brachyistius]
MYLGSISMSCWSEASFSAVLLGLLGLCWGSLSPRMSFFIGDPERALTHFTRPDAQNTTTLLLSEDGDTLFVGARDALFALDVSKPGVIEMMRKLDWEPTNELSVCQYVDKKGDCHNFIRVLQLINATHMYACGTFAFSPRCIYINLQTFNFDSTAESGKGQCPMSPYSRNTAIVVDGELYVGTPEDLWENQPGISRYLSQEGRKNLKLVENRLKKATFISSTFVSSENKVYYFLNEVSTVLDKHIVPHVAQVCTSDVGGQRILWKQWTTFAKAGLVCQSAGSLPFNVMRDVVTLPPLEDFSPDETLFYALFSSQWSVNSKHSAVCVFRLGDVKNVFSGKYRSFNERIRSSVTPGTCGIPPDSDADLNFVKENFVAEASVNSAEKGFILMPDHNYSNLAALRTKAANGRSYTVLFMLTESGFLHKVVLLEKGPHVIEETQVFKRPQSVKNVLLSITKDVVFVGTSEGVFQVPISNCSFYWNCGECVLAQDPFCGWDPDQGVCSRVTGDPAGLRQDVENGNAMEACNLSNESSEVEKRPSPELLPVLLDKMVHLRCPKASNFASLRWERSDGRQLDQDTYLQQARGSLQFPALPDTLGQYLCISLENGHEQTLYSVIVMQDGPQIGSRDGSRNFRGVLVLSVLLAASLCLIALGGVCMLKQRHYLHAQAKTLSDRCEARD